MDRFKVLLTAPIDEAAIEMLKRVAEVKIASSPSEEALMEDIADVDAVIVRVPAKITRKVLESARRLKVIGRFGTGYDNIDVKAATERGVPVTYTPGANVPSVAQHTICLMMALTNQLLLANEALKKGRWEFRLKYEGMELQGKTVGIIGLGSIGAEVAKICKTLGMKVLYYDVIRYEEKEKKLEVEFVPLTEEDEKKGLKVPGKLLKESEFITLHVPLIDKTMGMIGEKEINLMKDGAFVINTARGGIVDEKALYKGLQSGKLKGAGLDVFEQEPPSPKDPLLKLENVIATPHIAGVTKDSARRMAIMVVENVIKALHGEVPINLANPEVLKISRASS